MTMVRGMTVLLVCQLAGEVTARALNLPAPGPVLGMLLLFGMLLWRGAPDWLDQVGQGLLRLLPLFFVPAGVGIMNHVQLMQSEWLAIAVTLLVSTVITMIVTAGALLLLLRLTAGREASRNATNHD
jgi:holin-like protein